MKVPGQSCAHGAAASCRTSPSAFSSCLSPTSHSPLPHTPTRCASITRSSCGTPPAGLLLPPAACCSRPLASSWPAPSNPAPVEPSNNKLLGSSTALSSTWLLLLPAPPGACCSLLIDTCSTAAQPAAPRCLVGAAVQGLSAAAPCSYGCRCLRQRSFGLAPSSWQPLPPAALKHSC